MNDDITIADSDSRPTDDSPREPLMHEIVSTVAEANDCRSLDLRPVSNVVDPEALEALLAAPNTTVAVRFTYEGGVVRVSDAGVEFDVL